MHRLQVLVKAEPELFLALVDERVHSLLAGVAGDDQPPLDAVPAFVR